MVTVEEDEVREKTMSEMLEEQQQQQREVGCSWYGSS